MNFKQILPYKLRCALTIGAIAGSTLTACDNHANEPQEPITPTRDVELFLTRADEIEEEDVKKYADMSDVRYIYIIPKDEREWNTYTKGNIHILRNYLTVRINVNPTKVRGRGNFCFVPGEALKAEQANQDSTWYVQHGWTINQKQR